MLRHLHIRQFAIIESLEVDFGPGMTVLTGETGAGKSILIDALGLLLGDRADSDSVRDGAKRAEISAEFDLADAQKAQRWLLDHEMTDEDEPTSCLIRRSIGSDGRGRATINGSPVTVRDLKKLGETLLDIHGQHAHQSLLKSSEQRDLLDDFGKHMQLRRQIAELCQNYRQTEERLAALTGTEDHSQRIEFLRYQISELEALKLGDDELTELEAEHRRLANAGRLLEDGQRALALLDGDEDGSSYELIGQAANLLSRLGDLDSRLGEIAELAESARIQVQDAAGSLRDHLEAMDLDPARLEWVNNRLTAIHDLARKHQVAAQELPAHLVTLSHELAQLQNAGKEIQTLQAQLSELRIQYQECAKTLHTARCKTGKALATSIEAAIRELGMPQASFDISIQARDDEQLHVTGSDQIEFLICANPGQTARPLSKVASGGELSRISLAIQVIAANSTHVPSLIFDEVDAGIGGGVAEIVGRQLKTLGATRQTLCVTHLPQVAAQANQQLYVSKEVVAGQTSTSIRPLIDKERIEELARMLGGVDITEQTRAHAQEMLLQAAG